MSRNEKGLTLNRTELNVLIVRYYRDQRDFCRIHNVVYTTFRNFLQGKRVMPKLELLLAAIMLKYGVNPYAPTPELPSEVA